MPGRSRLPFRAGAGCRFRTEAVLSDGPAPNRRLRAGAVHAGSEPNPHAVAKPIPIFLKNKLCIWHLLIIIYIVTFVMAMKNL